MSNWCVVKLFGEVEQIKAAAEAALAIPPALVAVSQAPIGDEPVAVPSGAAALFIAAGALEDDSIGGALQVAGDIGLAFQTGNWAPFRQNVLADAIGESTAKAVVKLSEDVLRPLSKGISFGVSQSASGSDSCPY